MHPLFNQRRYLIPFRGTLLPQIFGDTLVIGTGVAGLRAALAAAEHGEVIVLAKSDIERSSTSWAQGGVAAALEPENVTSHMQDTIDAGVGLCDVDAVNDAVVGAAARMQELADWGVQFDRTDDGEVALGREGAHRQARVWHCGGDTTGKEIVRCLSERVLEHPRIRVFEHCFALDLLTASDSVPDPAVLGAITYHEHHGLQMIWAASTILATGGAGQVYRETTNPSVATGDGLAMAYRAGARIADMAFIQFHPTTLYIAGSERALISEAVRGEGAYLVDRRGERFMTDRHPMADLAPRDVVSRGIRDHLARTGDTHVFLDARHFKAGFFARRFPGITDKLSHFDIDPERDLIPVHPSAHYTIGGVWVDPQTRTNLPGLYACGEVACTGLHGANRLASNSLLEGLVFGETAGRTCSERYDENRTTDGEIAKTSRRVISHIPPSDRGELDLEDVRSSLRSVMWRHLGLTRDRQEMSDVQEMIEFWGRYTLDKVFDDPPGWETQNLLYTAALVCDSALWREESRGTHARSDFVDPKPGFRVHDLWSRAQDEVMTIAATSDEASPSPTAGT